jgi:hypothetical protein
MTTPVLPALYDAADEASLSGQRWFLLARRVQLALLVVAALVGLMTVEFRSVDLAGVVVLLAFASVLVTELLVEKNQSQRAWFEGRAVAESIKHLAWKYAVRADPFISDEAADEIFVGRARETLGSLDSLRLPPASGDQITPWMRETRNSGSEHRRRTYLVERLEDQQGWYATRATQHQKSAAWWRLVLYVLVILGAVAGVAKTLSFIGDDVIGDVDVIGLAATAASTAKAWSESRQYDTLAVAYGAASHDLASNHSLAATVPESDEAWSKFVNDAEDAISREHRMWTASRSGRLY